MYEFKVEPLERSPRSARGIRSPADRFAHAFSEILNESARYGWEFVRTESFPVERRTGLFRKKLVVEESFLIFRRPIMATLQSTAQANMPMVAPPSADNNLQPTHFATGENVQTSQDRSIKADTEQPVRAYPPMTRT